jgi:hypothetical protein
VLSAVLVAASGVARADALGDVRARREAVAQAEAQLGARKAVEARLEREAKELAAAVDREKAAPSTMARDLRLGQLLAEARQKSDALDAAVADRERAAKELERARRALVAACDAALAQKDLGGEAQRLELTRLRTAQVTLLVQPGSTLVAPRLPEGPVVADPLDGPRELEDKADLLRDSADKLRREAARLLARIDDVERRRHLRERAGAVDEDWFNDAAWSRRAARAPGSGLPASRGGNESAQAAPNAPSTGGSGSGSFSDSAGPSAPTAGAGGAGGAPPPSAGGTGGDRGGVGGGPTGVGGGVSGGGRDSTAVLRNLVDPSTLEELRRADGSDDLDRQLRALRRAESELLGMARDLHRRADSLAARAADLRKRK